MRLWAILFAATLTAVLIALFRQLVSRLDAPKERPPESLEDLSTANYVPMQRLLDGRDFEFLAAQPGYEPEVARQLHADRREIVVGYLKLLTRDFKQLVAIAKHMQVYSTEDQPGFGEALLWQQITFYYAVTSVRCRLAWVPLGS